MCTLRARVLLRETRSTRLRTYLLHFQPGIDLPAQTNLGGSKSGCTSNLIVADGVLNAPDYIRTCTREGALATASLEATPLAEIPSGGASHAERGYERVLGHERRAGKRCP